MRGLNGCSGLLLLFGLFVLETLVESWWYDEVEHAGAAAADGALAVSLGLQQEDVSPTRTERTPDVQWFVSILLDLSNRKGKVRSGSRSHSSIMRTCHNPI